MIMEKNKNSGVKDDDDDKVLALVRAVLHETLPYPKTKSAKEKEEEEEKQVGRPATLADRLGISFTDHLKDAKHELVFMARGRVGAQAVTDLFMDTLRGGNDVNDMAALNAVLTCEWEGTITTESFERFHRFLMHVRELQNAHDMKIWQCKVLKHPGGLGSLWREDCNESAVSLYYAIERMYGEYVNATKERTKITVGERAAKYIGDNLDAGHILEKVRTRLVDRDSNDAHMCYYEIITALVNSNIGPQELVETFNRTCARNMDMLMHFLSQIVGGSAVQLTTVFYSTITTRLAEMFEGERRKSEQAAEEESDAQKKFRKEIPDPGAVPKELHRDILDLNTRVSDVTRSELVRLQHARREELASISSIVNQRVRTMGDPSARQKHQERQQKEAEAEAAQDEKEEELRQLTSYQKSHLVMMLSLFPWSSGVLYAFQQLIDPTSSIYPERNFQVAEVCISSALRLVNDMVERRRRREEAQEMTHDDKGEKSPLFGMLWDDAIKLAGVFEEWKERKRAITMERAKESMVRSNEIFDQLCGHADRLFKSTEALVTFIPKDSTEKMPIPKSFSGESTKELYHKTGSMHAAWGALNACYENLNEIHNFMVEVMAGSGDVHLRYAEGMLNVELKSFRLAYETLKQEEAFIVARGLRDEEGNFCSAETYPNTFWERETKKLFFGPVDDSFTESDRRMHFLKDCLLLVCHANNYTVHVLFQELRGMDYMTHQERFILTEESGDDDDGFSPEEHRQQQQQTKNKNAKGKKGKGKNKNKKQKPKKKEKEKTPLFTGDGAIPQKE